MNPFGKRQAAVRHCIGDDRYICFGRRTPRSETVVEGRDVNGPEATAAAVANRTPCDVHNQVAGGTPTSSTMQQPRCAGSSTRFAGTTYSACFAACRTIDALIGDTPRRRAISSDRSHKEVDGSQSAGHVAIGSPRTRRTPPATAPRPPICSRCTQAPLHDSADRRHRRAIRDRDDVMSSVRRRL